MPKTVDRDADAAFLRTERIYWPSYARRAEEALGLPRESDVLTICNEIRRQEGLRKLKTKVTAKAFVVRWVRAGFQYTGENDGD